MRNGMLSTMVALFLLVPFAELQAGDPPVTVGDRIRIRASNLDIPSSSPLFQTRKVSMFASESFLVGRVMEIENGEIVVMAEGGPAEEKVEIREVNRFEVWSPGTYATGGAFLGLLAGGVIGGFMGNSLEKEEPASASDANCTSYICSDIELDLDLGPPPTVQGVFFGAIVGASLGYLVGSRLPRDHWQQVEVPKLGVRVTANLRDDVGLVCSMSF